MILSEKNKMKAEDYLIFERSSELRHEFVDGAIFSMAGASKKHNQISSNLVRMIGNDLLKKPCNIYSSDMRVKNKNVERIPPWALIVQSTILNEEPPPHQDRYRDSLKIFYLIFNIIIFRSNWMEHSNRIM